MIEIPEAVVLARQITETLYGKRIQDVTVNQTPHKFGWFFGDPVEYPSRLMGKTIEKAEAYGGFVEILLGAAKLVISDGINLRYLSNGEKMPPKHQLLIYFDDRSALVASVQMYGGMWCFEDEAFDNEYYSVAKKKPSPLIDAFDFNYYKNILYDADTQKKSLKAALATEQRIPGLGNGVLQDILFNARIHPKRKVFTLTNNEIERLYQSIKTTLQEMVENGGRDTEKNIFGFAGGYVTKMSKYTLDKSCQVCGSKIVKSSYMGGSIYYCERCQKEVV